MRDERNDSDYAALAAKALAAVQPSTVPPPMGDRADTIAAIEHALRARTRGRVRPWWVLAPLLAAAAAAVVLVSGGRWPGGANPNLSTAAMTLDGLRAGAELRGARSIELATGTRLHLDAHATAKIVDLGAVQLFRLETGGLRAEVAKLTSGRRFLIETPDAEVEVRGTRFDVVMSSVPSSCGPATRTRVAVHEGVVSVRFEGSEVRLGPGAVWPDCASQGAVGASATPAVPSPSLAAAQVSGATPSGPRVSSAATKSDPRRVRREASRPASLTLPGSTAPSSPPLPVASASPITGGAASTLAEQNDLLAAALAARHRGDRAEALRWLERLLTRYPDGQLVDSARGERQRLLDARAVVREREPE